MKKSFIQKKNQIFKKLIFYILKKFILYILKYYKYLL
jgi:hypothetical protein